MAAKRLNSFWAKENRNIPLKSESDHINTINPSMHWWINCVNMITKIVQRCVLLLQCTTKSANNQYFWSSNEWLRTGTKSVWSHSTKRGVTFAMQNGTSRGRNLNYHFREIKSYFSCKAIFKENCHCGHQQLVLKIWRSNSRWKYTGLQHATGYILYEQFLYTTRCMVI